MQAKIIQVIEVSEFVPYQTELRKTYFLPDGQRLVPFDPFSDAVPADPNIRVDVHEDGSVTASTISAH